MPTKTPTYRTPPDSAQADSRGVQLVDLSGEPYVAGGATGIGGTADAAASSDTGSFSLIALIKRLLTYMADTSAVPYYPYPGSPVSGATAAMTGVISTQVLAAPAAGLRNYVTSFVISNSHGSVSTDVEVLDGNGGAVLMTIPAACLYGGAVIALPTPLKQPTSATRLDLRNTITGASVKGSAVGFTAQ